MHSYLLFAGGLALLLGLLPPSAQAQVAVDLNTWAQQGPAGNGTWTVEGGGSSVVQSINGDPTFFVSPGTFSNTTIEGTFAVEGTGDDDYIGFVFGYQTPNATSGAAAEDFEFLLLDWKQSDQTFGGRDAEQGLVLSKVDGGFPSFGGDTNFWHHDDDNPGVFDVLAAWNTAEATNVADPGSQTTANAPGWQDNAVYTFELLYQTNRIRIRISSSDDAAFSTPTTIFDVTPSDVGLASFPDGRFGFYNYSQDPVRYTGFTTNNVPTVAINGLTLDQGAAQALTTADVEASDAQDPPADLTFTVTTPPTNGTLYLDGTPLGTNDTFTQADIDNGDVAYIHDGSGSTSDSFLFDLDDPAGDGPTGETFPITINADPNFSGSFATQVDGTTTGPVAFTGTGVTLDLATGPTGSGTVHVRQVDEAPASPDGISPQFPLANVRVVVTVLGSTLSFDAATQFILDETGLGFTTPSSVTLFRRPTEGSGTFTELATTYDGGAGTFAATTDQFSEFAAAQTTFQFTVTGEDGTGNDTGWRMLAVPTPSQRSDFEDDFGFSFDALSSGAVMHTYDSNQYQALTSSSSSIDRGAGVMLYFFDDADDPLTSSGITIDVPDNSADQTSDLTVSGLATSDRFEILGNPFDVQFDLGSLRQTATNGSGTLVDAGFSNTVGVYNGDTQQFEFFQASAGDDIPAFNGFVIERQTLGAGDTELVFDAAGKGTGSGSLIGSQSVTAEEAARIVMQLETTDGPVLRDQAVLYFSPDATSDWDPYDFSELAPPLTDDGYVSIAFPGVRNGETVLRAFASEPGSAMEDVNQTIPLAMRGVGTSGSATLRWPEGDDDMVPAEWTVSLEDTQTGTITDLRAAPDGYTFPLSPSDAPGSPSDARFRLHVHTAPLPVELTRFTARPAETSVHLAWTTASETNNAGFHVERRVASPDAAWTSIGFVEGAGTRQTAQTYRFVDDALPPGTEAVAYRLRQTDLDGTTTLSAVQHVTLPVQDVALYAPFPNPSSGPVTLRYALPNTAHVQIAAYDLLGRRVALLRDGVREKGTSDVTFDASSWGPGVYLLRLQTGTHHITRRLTVLR